MENPSLVPRSIKVYKRINGVGKTLNRAVGRIFKNRYFKPYRICQPVVSALPLNRWLQTKNHHDAILSFPERLQIGILHELTVNLKLLLQVTFNLRGSI